MAGVTFAHAQVLPLYVSVHVSLSTNPLLGLKPPNNRNWFDVPVAQICAPNR